MDCRCKYVTATKNICILKTVEDIYHLNAEVHAKAKTSNRRKTTDDDNQISCCRQEAERSWVSVILASYSVDKESS